MKKRIDLLLAEAGIAPSREKAKNMVIEGIVRVNGICVKNPSDTFPEEGIKIEITGNPCPYVSRGGYKLEKALKVFSYNPEGKVFIDIGASTGGFTDCLLMGGAAFVYAVDVGYGQFDWKLRNDDRVKLYERTNARYLKCEMFKHALDAAVIDVSFISLGKILPALSCLERSAEFDVLALIKPQFEAGRRFVGKKGVVRDPAVHKDVIKSVRGFAEDSGYTMPGISYSPVKGPNGNIEFICRLSNHIDANVSDSDIDDTVSEAHTNLE